MFIISLVYGSINAHFAYSRMRNKTEKYTTLYTALVILATIILNPQVVFALVLQSGNYQIENPSFSTGGGNRNSATYRAQDATGTASGTSNSTNYQVQSGAIPPIFPGVPGVPTLTNTGSTLYANLDFVIATGGNASDTQFAIAISSDNFTTTTFVKADDTITSATEVWQDYAGWGSGSGERLIGLAPNTTYKIKVKARLGPNNESGYSNIASATTSNPSLTMTVAGVSSGTSVAGTTTNVTTTATTVPFGQLSVGSIKIGAQTVTVSTNAVTGYTTTITQDGALRKTNGTTIAAVSATNASPAAWPLSITDGRFGYHTTDSLLCTGTTNRFSINDTFAALTTTPTEIACNTGPVTNESTSLVFKVEVEGLQPPGDYQNVISYVTSALY